MRIAKNLGPASCIVIIGAIAAVIQTIIYVRSNSYIAYRMHWLTVDALREAANSWLIISLGVCCGVLLLYGAAHILTRGFDLHVRDSRTVVIIKVVLICIGTTLVCWGLYYFVFDPLQLRIRWRAALTLITVVGCLVFAMLYIWRGWRPALTERMAAAAFLTAILYVCCVLVLNSALAVKTKNAALAQKPNVILVVIDCLRARDLGFWGSPLNASPAIDGLAERGAVFKNAYSNSPWTRPAVASLFTSQYPGIHGTIGYFDALSDKWLTLAEVLKNRGYHTCFFDGGNYNFARTFNFQQGFDHFESELTKKNATVLTNEFLSYLERPVRQPFFGYIHYMDAHLPYERNEFTDMFVTGENRFFDPGTRASDLDVMWFFGIVRKLHWAGKLSSEDHRYLKGLYDSQIRFIDANIQRIVSFLEHTQLLDTTIIIITSDHGEEFWEHDNYEHGHTLYNELLHVPLIIAGPGIEHKTIKDTVQLLDVMPTVADLVNIKLPGGYCQGVSLYAAITGNGTVPQRPVFASGTHYGDEKFCIIADDKKVIFNTGDTTKKGKIVGYTSPERFEFYNLTQDPFEQNLLSDDADGEFASLKDTLLRFSESSLPELKQKAVVDTSLRQKLESIGYVQ